jgi:hypothetical protein
VTGLDKRGLTRTAFLRTRTATRAQTSGQSQNQEKTVNPKGSGTLCVVGINRFNHKKRAYLHGFDRREARWQQ